MNPYEFPLALFAFLALVAAAPVWLWFTSQYPTISQMGAPTRFLVQLSFPATCALFLIGWLEPG